MFYFNTIHQCASYNSPEFDYNCITTQKKYQFPAPNTLRASLNRYITNVFLQQKTDCCKISPVNEAQNVWKLYLDEEKYDMALRYTKIPEQINKIKIKYAQYCLHEGEQQKSA